MRWQLLRRNRRIPSINGGAETFYAVNAADQLCHTALAQAACGSAPSGAQTFQYDFNGNLTGQSDGRVLTHNSKDQTTSFKPGGALAQTTNMTYLGAGQSERTTAGGSTFKNGPPGLAINSSGLLSSISYVRDPDGGLVSMRNGSTAYYYLFDRLGSVVALTDSAGNAVNRYFYDPYGNYLVGTTEAVANPWQYAGGFKGAFSGYYKFGARYYDPVIGRWTQPDPSGMDANSYAYAGSNPVNFVDSTGLATCTETVCRAARYLWRHFNLNYAGCAVICGTLTVAQGHVYASVGGVGIVTRGWGIGWSSHPLEEQGDTSAFTCAAFRVGACLATGTLPQKEGRPVETSYSVMVFSGYGAAAGGQYQWKVR